MSNPEKALVLFWVREFLILNFIRLDMSNPEKALVLFWVREFLKFFGLWFGFG